MNELFNPKVSIIIPVYNGANYLKQAIDSALAQTYQNFEIIVVNDGSKDENKTENIAKSYDNKITYYSKPNGGCASALNFGIEKMTGDYFSWLSHDDMYYPNKIQNQINLLNTLSDKNTMIYSAFELVDKDGKFITQLKPENIYPRHKLDMGLFALLRSLINGCSLLIPKTYFYEYGMFDATLPTTQDYALWFKMLRTGKIKYLDEILVKSRSHPEQGTYAISGHIDECNTLWIGFIDALTKEERLQLEGSEYHFYRKTADFLHLTPYRKAEEHALMLLKTKIPRSKIWFYGVSNLAARYVRRVIRAIQYRRLVPSSLLRARSNNQ